ncbi:MAG TPA: L,D-transpeptidase [Polyangiaceae bacterium]
MMRDGEPLQIEPDAHARRHGTAAKGARLPLYGSVRGNGCARRWLLVGPLAWVCEDQVLISQQPTLSADARPITYPDGLPHQYFFVGQNGALGYRDLGHAEETAPDVELEPGFALAIVGVQEKSPGVPFALTSRGSWVPLRDLSPANPASFQGVELDPAQTGAGELGWVVADSTQTYDRPAGKPIRERNHSRFEAIQVFETQKQGGRRWMRIGEREWVRSEDVRVRSAAPVPPVLRPDERWIDVDLDQQILTAYIGNKAVFSTMVSTGKGREGTPEATPKGAFRIWAKLRGSDMDNLEDEDASRYYAIQQVPWVMFFKQGYALHGTFWHRGFGNVRSHGCINLSPLDAQRLFFWTRPRLPSGWTAVLPSPFDPGTLIVVR